MVRPAGKYTPLSGVEQLTTSWSADQLLLVTIASKNPPQGYFYKVLHFKIVENNIFLVPRKTDLINNEFELWYSLMDFTDISSSQTYTFTQEATEEWYKGFKNFLTLLSN